MHVILVAILVYRSSNRYSWTVDFPFILSVLLFSLLMSFRKCCAGMSTVNCEFSREQGGFSNCVQLCTRQQQLIKYLEYVPLHLLGVVLLITLCGMVCLHSG